MKPSEVARVQNLLGAISIGISDRILESAERCVGHGGETAAAVMQIGTTPHMSIDELSTSLKLSHSATVRLVAKLSADDLVERAPGEDRREVRLALSKKGRTICRSIKTARAQALADLTGRLSSKEVATLGSLLERMLGHISRSEQDSIYICRYCDEGACPQDRCPTLPPA